MQVRSSPSDSLRPAQTRCSWLGVKGSRVQIPPSRQKLQVRGHITSPVSGLKIF